MAKYTLYQVDAFTREKLAGNPAGVVTNADGLSEKQMLRIAREMNNSETAFMFSPDTDDHDVHVRFFTPTMEVPICGHATIASHYVRAMELGLANARVLQKTGAGILPVDIRNVGGDYSVEMTQGAIEFGEPLAADVLGRMLAALGIGSGELIDAPVRVVSTGHGKVMVGIKNAALLNSLQPDMATLAATSREIGCNGYYVFVLNGDGAEHLAQGRMFAPAAGIDEDPVTGNANGPLGAYLVRHGLAAHNGRNLCFSAVQGEAMGRRGVINVSIDIENGEPVLARVAGNAVVVFRTELEL